MLFVMTDNGMNTLCNVQSNDSLTFHTVSSPIGEYLTIFEYFFTFLSHFFAFLTFHASVMTDTGMYTPLNDHSTESLIFHIVSRPIGEFFAYIFRIFCLF
jgi:hypothetical protein